MLKTHHWKRTAVALSVLALVSCSNTETPSEFRYHVGLLTEPTTDNYWASRDTAKIPENGYLLELTKPKLYTHFFPGMEFVHDLAATDELIQPQQEGDFWTVTIPMRHDAVWSNGSAISPDDVVFTFETVRDLALGGDWATWYPVTGTVHLIAVEKVDDHTVKYGFNQRPPLSIWPFALGLAPVMPKAFWSDKVAAALAEDDPRLALYSTSGTGDLSGGPMVFEALEPGSGAVLGVNQRYYDKGRQVISGGVSYEMGPHIDGMQFTVYDTQESAVAALQAGEIHYLFTPEGIQRNLVERVLEDPALGAITNPTNGYSFIGFNLRKNPTANRGFRDAMALIIDKEFLADAVLQGVVTPVYGSVPKGNLAWYNPEAADLQAAEYAAKSTETRLQGAVEALRGGGFTWQVEPTFLGGEIHAGSGIMYEGAPVPALTILAPGQSYDPIRATSSLWIEAWLNQLGFLAEASPTDLDSLIQSVFVPDQDHQLHFDMFILGVGDLGSPAWPSHHEAFWASYNDSLVNEGNNGSGFHDEEFDSLVAQYQAAATPQEAFELVWRMEEIIAREKPFIFLYENDLVEAYRSNDIRFPFTTALGGIQALYGLPQLVAAP